MGNSEPYVNAQRRIHISVCVMRCGCLFLFYFCLFVFVVVVVLFVCLFSLRSTANACISDNESLRVATCASNVQ